MIPLHLWKFAGGSVHTAYGLVFQTLWELWNDAYNDSANADTRQQLNMGIIEKTAKLPLHSQTQISVLANVPLNVSLQSSTSGNSRIRKATIASTHEPLEALLQDTAEPAQTTTPALSLCLGLQSQMPLYRAKLYTHYKYKIYHRKRTFLLLFLSLSFSFALLLGN